MPLCCLLGYLTRIEDEERERERDGMKEREGRGEWGMWDPITSERELSISSHIADSFILIEHHIVSILISRNENGKTKRERQSKLFCSRMK